MPVLVSRTRDSVVLGFSNMPVEQRGDMIAVALPPQQASYLLVKMAELLGYKITMTNPAVFFRLEGPNTVVASVVEGGSERKFAIPVEVIDAFIDVLRNYQNMTVTKRQLMAEVAQRLLSTGRKEFEELKKFFAGGAFDWEKFFGDRTAFYQYFRIPVMILEKAEVIESRRGRYIRVREVVSRREVLEQG